MSFLELSCILVNNVSNSTRTEQFVHTCIVNIVEWDQLTKIRCVHLTTRDLALGKKPRRQNYAVSKENFNSFRNRKEILKTMLAWFSLLLLIIALLLIKLVIFYSFFLNSKLFPVTFNFHLIHTSEMECLAETVNYFRRALHLRCVKGFWIHLC